MHRRRPLALGMGIAAMLQLGVAAQERTELRPGLLAEYYDLGKYFSGFPSVAHRQPVNRRVIPKIDFELTLDEIGGSGLKDFFYARWTGVIRVPKEAVYTFHVQSDDGAMLRIDGKIIVGGPVGQVLTERSGRVTLGQGDHDLRIDYFELGKFAACKLMWEGPDRAKEVVPPEALFHCRDKALDPK